MSKYIARKHFKTLGYSIKRNQCLMDFTSLSFDVVSKNREELNLHWVEEGEVLKKVIDMSALIAKINKIKICLAISSEERLQADDIYKARVSNIDIYKIDGQHLLLLTEGIDIEEKNKLASNEIKNTIKNVNKIFKIKFGFPIFNTDRGHLIEKLKSEIENERDCIYQIATLSSLFELLNTSELKLYLNPPQSPEETEAFDKNYSIMILKSFFERGINESDSRVIKTFQNLRALRNITPVHESSTQAKKVCRELIGKQTPRNDAEWKQLGEVAFQMFREQLIQFRDIIKTK